MGSSPNGPTPPQQMAAIPITVLVPQGYSQVEIAQVTARLRSPGGIQGITRPVQFALGLPPQLVVRLFLGLAAQGLVHAVVGEHEDGTPVLEPVPGDMVFVLTEPPKEQQPPAPPSRIIQP